jgi:hypothetical protein
MAATNPEPDFTQFEAILHLKRSHFASKTMLFLDKK